MLVTDTEYAAWFLFCKETVLVIKNPHLWTLDKPVSAVTLIRYLTKTAWFSACQIPLYLDRYIVKVTMKHKWNDYPKYKTHICFLYHIFEQAIDNVSSQLLMSLVAELILSVFRVLKYHWGNRSVVRHSLRNCNWQSSTLTLHFTLNDPF